MAVCVPGSGPARPGHRHPRLKVQEYRLGQAVLHRVAVGASRPGGGHHRPGTGPGERDRGPNPRGLPQHRAVREQPVRV